MPVKRGRPGLTLLELLVSVSIAGVLVVAATALVRAASGAAARELARGRAAAITEEVLSVTVALVEQAMGAVVLGDSALVIESHVMDGIPCPDGTMASLVHTPAIAPEPGDRWRVLERAETTAGGDTLFWRPSSLMPLQVGGTRCAASDSTRLLVRVVRRARIEPYRTAQGVWMLGFRHCPDGCDLMQPLAGPIRPPAERGWQLRAVACGVEVGVRVLEAAPVHWRLARVC